MDTQITELIQRMREGDAGASQELMPLVYSELRKIAAKYLRRERKDHTLQPTALVNEVYIRMFGGAAPSVADKAHFLAIASQMMRRILVDYARSRTSGRRGGELHRVEADGLEWGTDNGISCRCSNWIGPSTNWPLRTPSWPRRLKCDISEV